MKKTILFIFYLIITSCSKENVNNADIANHHCLQKIDIIESGNNTCNLDSWNNNECKEIKLGKIEIPLNVKINYNDFCLINGEEINFTNNLGAYNKATIANKKYRETQDQQYYNKDSTDCEIYCIKNEEAIIQIASDKFSLEINLQTRVKFGIDSLTINDNIVTSYDIRSVKYDVNSSGYGSSRLYWLDIENNVGEIIFPDTIKTNYHESIILNGKTYSELFSNKASNLKKEIVYFHRQNGLIGVIDTLGELWIKEN